MKINENILIKKGNCLELMKKIPDAQVDLLLTDPPFEIGKERLSRLLTTP